MENSTISKQDQIDAIWSNTKLNGKTAIYQGSLKNLTPKSDEEILELFNQLPEEEEVAIVSVDDLVASATDITAHLNTNGEQYLCIALPLVETNGLTFKFKFEESTVVVAGDLDIYRAHKMNPIQIGDILLFNYDGSDTFKNLDTKGLFKVANNNRDFPFRGTISKSQNQCFAEAMMVKTLKAEKRQTAIMETADKHDTTTRKVRQVMANNLTADIVASMKSLLAE